MSELFTFGDPARFEIALRWVTDRTPRRRLPADGGWSAGEIRITVGNQVLTRHRRGDTSKEAVGWYLLPVFEWLAANWLPLLHEEHFGWIENGSVPAATATFFAFRSAMDGVDGIAASEHAAVQTWWSRHALRAADSSALYPDLFIRRMIDQIELSWTSRQPSFAPNGFRLELAPGVATLDVADVASPLWDALQWATATASVSNEADIRAMAGLTSQLKALQAKGRDELEAVYLTHDLFERLRRARERRQLRGGASMLPNAPALERMEDAVLMFGGVEPGITERDMETLLELIDARSGRHDSTELAALVRDDIGMPLAAPYEEGYELAEDLLEEKALAIHDSINIDDFVRSLQIDVHTNALDTKSIRGVALAGENYAPAILINSTSSYNQSESGRRFTLAHELFHILYDRSRARRIAHTSGPWAPRGIEQRANAFAAMLLMPRHVVRRLLTVGSMSITELRQVALMLRVSLPALVEHLYNIGEIDDAKRHELRTEIEQGKPPAH